jgi:hypothetical protein
MLDPAQAQTGQARTFEFADTPPTTFPATTPSLLHVHVQPQQPEIQRQWAAFMQHAGCGEDMAADVLARLDWANLGRSCVVNMHVGVGIDAPQMRLCHSLASRYPQLQIVAQRAA